jgi:hypothetical protein
MKGPKDEPCHCLTQKGCSAPRLADILHFPAQRNSSPVPLPCVETCTNSSFQVGPEPSADSSGSSFTRAQRSHKIALA